MFQGCHNIFLYFVKYFADKYGVRGSRFGWFLGSSRNHPKSIATCAGIKISNFEIIKTSPTPHNYNEKLKQTKQSPKCFAVFWAILTLLENPLRTPQGIPQDVPQRQQRSGIPWREPLMDPCGTLVDIHGTLGTLVV